MLATGCWARSHLHLSLPLARWFNLPQGRQKAQPTSVLEGTVTHVGEQHWWSPQEGRGDPGPQGGNNLTIGNAPCEMTTVTKALGPWPLKSVVADQEPCKHFTQLIIFNNENIPYRYYFKKASIISPRRVMLLFLYISFQPFHIMYILICEYIFYIRCVCVYNTPLSGNPFLKK